MSSPSNTTLPNTEGHGDFPYLTFILVVLTVFCIGIYLAGAVHKRLIAERGYGGRHESQNHDQTTDRTPVREQVPDFTDPNWKTYRPWPIPVAPPTSIVLPEYPRLPPVSIPPKRHDPNFPGFLHTHQGPMACRARLDPRVGQTVRVGGTGKCKGLLGRVVAIMAEDHAGRAGRLFVELDTELYKHIVLPANELIVVNPITGQTGS